MKNLLLVLTIMIGTMGLNAQSLSEFFQNNDSNLTWLGVDYSKMKLIGAFPKITNSNPRSGSDDLRKKYLMQMNDIFATQPKKYDFKGMLKQDYISYDIEMMVELNENSKQEGLAARRATVFSTDDIQGYVANYNIKSKEGLGILIITESLNKTLQKATYHFVIIDMKTKNILLQDVILCNPTGFGFRNYWAGSVYHLVKQVKKEYYEKWKSESLKS